MTDFAPMRDHLEPTPDPAWLLRVEGYDPLRQASLESRFAISNGFLGVRAGRAVTRGASWGVLARTYIAGLFDGAADLAGPGLVPAPDWLCVRVLLADGPLVRHPSDLAGHRMTLDLKRGVLLSGGQLRPSPDAGAARPSGRLATSRLASLADRGIGLQLIQFEIESGGCEITFEASFESVDIGLVIDRLEEDVGVWRTNHAGKSLAMAAESSLRIDGRLLAPTRRGDLTSSWTWTCRAGQIVSFERIVAVVRSDAPGADPGAASREKLRARRGNSAWMGWSPGTRRRGRPAGPAAMWWSMATRRTSRHCGSRSII